MIKRYKKSKYAVNTRELKPNTQPSNTDNSLESDLGEVGRVLGLPNWPIPPQAQLKENEPGLTFVDGKKYMFFYDKKFSFEELSGREVWLAPYICLDMYGKRVRVEPKNRDHHDSWDPIQEKPAYHFNLNTILAKPDEVVPNRSNGLHSIAHRKDGIVLTYVKHNYIKSLDLPESNQYPSDQTHVIVKHCDNGDSYVLTSIVFKGKPDVG
jgi:hypothetical protein